MKPLLILVCLFFGAVILGQKAYRIVAPEPSAATEIGLQSGYDSHAETSIEDYWQKGVDTVKDFFAGKSLGSIILMATAVIVAVIVAVMLCLTIGFILLYLSISCLVKFLLFITDLLDL